MKKILPPGVSAADLDDALNAFAAVVDQQWVFTDAEDGLVSYLDPHAIAFS